MKTLRNVLGWISELPWGSRWFKVGAALALVMTAIAIIYVWRKPEVVVPMAMLGVPAALMCWAKPILTWLWPTKWSSWRYQGERGSLKVMSTVASVCTVTRLAWLVRIASFVTLVVLVKQWSLSIGALLLGLVAFGSLALLAKKRFPGLSHWALTRGLPVALAVVFMGPLPVWPVTFTVQQADRNSEVLKVTVRYGEDGLGWAETLKNEDDKLLWKIKSDTTQGLLHVNEGKKMRAWVSGIPFLEGVHVHRNVLWVKEYDPADTLLEMLPPRLLAAVIPPTLLVLTGIGVGWRHRRRRLKGETAVALVTIEPSTG